MDGRILARVLLALVLLAVLAGVGVYVYNAGVAQGMADSGKLVAPAPGGAPYPYYGGPFFYRPWGFGFPFLGLLFPLLFLLFFITLIRGIFWRGRWGWGSPRYDERGVPPAFDEWHRRAHEPRDADK